MLGSRGFMQLYPTDNNPVPDGATVGGFVAADGVRLRYARWATTAERSLGTVCLLQGRAESIEKYFEVVGDLRRRGFAVATFDWRGQGGSDRRLGNPRKGHVDSFEEYDRDLVAFMEQVALPDTPPPHYALAHSTGGLVCLRAAHDGKVRFSRMVLASPLLELAPMVPSQAVARRITALATAFGLGEVSLPMTRRARPIEDTPFAENQLTSDPVRFARNVEIAVKAPQVAIGMPTVGWFFAACRAMGEVAEPEFGAAIKVPVLFVSASMDKVVSPRAIEVLAGELRAGAHVAVAGAKHELMMERAPLREQFFAAFDAFVPGSY